MGSNRPVIPAANARNIAASLRFNLRVGRRLTGVLSSFIILDRNRAFRREEFTCFGKAADACL